MGARSEERRYGRTMRIGILSAASLAQQVVIEPARMIPGVEVAAIAARDRYRAEDIAERFGIAHVLDDYEALCVSPYIDAVYICTPPAIHKKWTLRALAAGKHVLCEKPFAANTSEAREMVAAGIAAKRVLMEAFHWRYHPLAERIREICDEEMGTIHALSAKFTVGHLDRSSNQFNFPLGGGALMDLGVYPLQWVRFVMGTEPEVVRAQMKFADPNLDVSADVELRFDGDVQANVHCSMEHGVPFSAQLMVDGELGTLVVTNPLAPQMGHEIALTTNSGTRKETVATTTSYYHQLLAFVAAVDLGAGFPTGGEDSIATMELVDAIYVAAGSVPRLSLPE